MNDLKDKWSPEDERFRLDCLNCVGDARVGAYGMEVMRLFKLCDSPIEKVFLLALAALIEVNTPLPFGRTIELPNGMNVRSGYTIRPQEHIGDYRVDFLIEYWGDVALSGNRPRPWTKPEIPLARVVAENDGSPYHKQTPDRVEYENARDRQLQAMGFKVFHYTGRLVNNRPMQCALDCLSLLTGRPAKAFTCPDIRRSYPTQAAPRKVEFTSPVKGFWNAVPVKA